MLEYNLGICRTAARSEFLELLYPVAFAVFLSRASQPAVDATVSRSAYPVKPHYRPSFSYLTCPNSLFSILHLPWISNSRHSNIARSHLRSPSPLHLFRGGWGPALGAIAPNDTSYLFTSLFLMPDQLPLLKARGHAGDDTKSPAV